MDYSGQEATALYKYQWDLIHNPKWLWFVWLEEEDEGKIGIYGVTWLGNILFGLYPDEQETEIETRIELFNHIHQEYEKYYSSSKTKDVNLSIDKYKSWSVRKASFKGIAKKVFQGLKTNDNTFTLWNGGIYFEEYTLEGKTYKVAVYSAKENIELNKNIRIKSFSELRYNKSIKAGYTKNYGLIAFYDTEGKMHMVIQIIGENPEKDVKQWLNYLGLILPSKEQEEEDKGIINKILDVILHNLDELNKIWGEEETKEKSFNNINIIENYKKSTNQAVKDAIKAVGDESKPACNVCTRAAFYYITGDPVLFPARGSCLDEFETCNSSNSNFLKGKISNDGSASDIVNDLANYKTNELKDFFTEITKIEGETYEQFWERLQNMVDNGSIIIGTYKTNHVFMLVAGGMCEVINNIEHTDGRFLKEEYKSNPKLEQGDKYGFSFATRSIQKVPRIIECGNTVKSANAALYANMDYKNAINIKWYKYIKR